MANRTKLTLKKKKMFLEQLRITANVTLSAAYCGFCRRVAYEHRDSDQEFADQWDEAVNEALDKQEEVLRRRAFDGVTKPIYQQGELAGFVTEYSDTLAMFLLKAYRPEKYRERSSLELTGKGGGPIRTKNDLDLSKLSVDELEQLKAICEKASPAS